MNKKQLTRCAGVWVATVLMASVAIAAPKKELSKLTPEGQKALAEYTGMLESLRADLKGKIPVIDEQKAQDFMAAHKEKRDAPKKVKDNKGKVTHAEPPTTEIAKLIVPGLEKFLGNDTLDNQLVKCAVLSTATPRGLAEFAQQGPEKKKLIDDLLADPKLMKEMLYEGGAKAGRYGKAMEIFRSIQSSSPRAKEGHFRRMALAIGLELAAAELNPKENVDPVKRYAFYEKSYLDKELISQFDTFSVWLYRHVTNDPHTDVDMLWMREMLWNYRPDQILAPEEYTGKVVGLMYSEFGHKKPEGDPTLSTSSFQQTIDKGGMCGAKAFFGRCLGRSFGIPVWGARLRSHTAMTYWTPKGWETILGVSFKNGFWTADAEPMNGIVFEQIAKLRNDPEEFIKVCRAQWAGDVLGEERMNGMDTSTGGLWNALAFSKMRLAVAEKCPPVEPAKLAPGEPKPRDPKGYPERLAKPLVKPEFKKVVVDGKGVITIPAVACISPTTNTEKIVFMNTRDGGMNLHYKRWEQPEPIVYEVTVPVAEKYALAANVVTVNQEQFFLLTVNDAKEPVNMKMPYTVGKWGTTEPVTIPLNKGSNRLSFTRTVPEDFAKEGYRFAGPQFGGITLKSFTLTPVR
jgi:hypothetical protein